MNYPHVGALTKFIPNWGAIERNIFLIFLYIFNNIFFYHTFFSQLLYIIHLLYFDKSSKKEYTYNMVCRNF